MMKLQASCSRDLLWESIDSVKKHNAVKSESSNSPPDSKKHGFNS